jgi:hypothetical protein
MPHDPEQLKNYLVSLGTDKVTHTGSDFLAHLTGVYDYLKKWGSPEHVMVAGLFHSIYGTEAFKCFSLPVSERHEVRRVVGLSAERVIYVFSAATWRSFQASVMTGNIRLLRDRFNGSPLSVTPQEFQWLLWVHLANALEQEARLDDERFKKDYADRARLWQIVAGKLGEVARRGWEEVYGEAREESPQPC